jgi:hypothetical protein
MTCAGEQRPGFYNLSVWATRDATPAVRRMPRRRVPRGTRIARPIGAGAGRCGTGLTLVGTAIGGAAGGLAEARMQHAMHAAVMCGRGTRDAYTRVAVHGGAAAEGGSAARRIWVYDACSPSVEASDEVVVGHARKGEPGQSVSVWALGAHA